MKRVLVIDNFDSFTYNLVHYLEALNCSVEVVRNNQLLDLQLDQIHHIILSPGPGLPQEAGDLIPFIQKYAPRKSILGICLGQQAIVALFGGILKPLTQVKHGISCSVTHYNNDVIYQNIPTDFEVGLYHSWHTSDLPKEIIPTAISIDGIIMSIKHCDFDLRAVQFHPESIMTPYGKNILKNWLKNG